MIRYGQFCPVAKAAEVFGDRWTPIIMRELCFGTRGFGDLLAAAPLISRTVLAQRLKELADAAWCTSRRSRRARVIFIA